MKPISVLVLPLALLVTGCAGTMTGLDGQGGFSCKAPDGISCASLSGVYANAVQNNLPGQRPTVKADNVRDQAVRINSAAPRSGEPIRSAQKVRRVWIAPWEDEDEVLHDQAYVYMVVDPGRWQVEHSRRKATEGYRPVMPPKAFTPQAPSPGERQGLQMERTTPSTGATSSMNSMTPLPGRMAPNGQGTE
jgi:conjugal transfer pilus assembly protein TraV